MDYICPYWTYVRVNKKDGSLGVIISNNVLHPLSKESIKWIMRNIMPCYFHISDERNGTGIIKSRLFTNGRFVEVGVKTCE